MKCTGKPENEDDVHLTYEEGEYRSVSPAEHVAMV